MKENIGKLFDRIASRYDAFNHLSSMGIDRLWRRQAVRGIQAKDAAVLDVAIGTADLAIAMLQCGVARQVEGIDLSPEMMRIGQEKAARKGLQDRITFTEGSALEMPYPDAQFSLVTAAYGVRNFSDLDKGLSEMYRVLRPGGELMILEFSYPQNRLIAALYDFYFKYIMTGIGSLLTGGDKASFTYFYQSVRGFVWGKEMLQHLEQAGFQSVSYQSQSFGISTIYRARK